jgi:hypothetical protein
MKNILKPFIKISTWLKIEPDSASCKITLGKKNVEGIQSSGNIYMTRDK